MCPVDLARRVASRTRCGRLANSRRAAVPCVSSRPSNPACEPDVRVEPPREAAARPHLARRATSRIPASELAPTHEPRNAVVPCALPPRIPAREPARRSCLACRATSRISLASPLCELLPHKLGVRTRLASCAPSVRWRQDFAVVRSTAAGAMAAYAPRCALGSSATAGCSRNAFPGVWRWQDFAVVRSRAAIRGNFLASCIPEGASDGKSAPSWQHIAAMHPKRAGIGKICAPCIRKAPQTAFRECIARRSCQGGALFAALAPRILPGSSS